MSFQHKVVAILIGSLCVAIGIQFFLKPVKVLDGGLIGVALILNYLIGTRVGVAVFLCSIPILTLAWFFNRTMLYNSGYGLMISSLAIDLLEPYHILFRNHIHLEPFSSSVIGGFIVGTGIGIMLRNEISTGGTDLLAQIVARMIAVNVGIIIFIFDGIIIGLGGFLLSIDTFLLSIVTITAGGMATSLFTLKRKNY